MSTLLRVQNLGITYRGGGLLTLRPSVTRAVEGVSFEIATGETFGLVGESGSGKSTIGRAVLRLVDPTDGQILFADTDIAGLRGRDLLHYRSQVQVVFQDPWSSLNPRRTIGDILSEPLRRHGMVANRTECRARVAELLDQVGLASYFGARYPRELSGGQRQRIGIARALALRPRLIVCDEAISALDVSTQAQVLNLLLELQAELGLSYLFIAHDLGVVHHVSHRIGVLHRGSLVEIGDAEAVYRRPQHERTRALIDAEPVPDPATQRARREARRATKAVSQSATPAL